MIIEAHGVHKTYRSGRLEVHALRGVDFGVEPGEMVAVMGPSGCGKTTLLNCLSGLDEIDSGEVHIEGADLRQMDDRRRTDYRGRRMGFIFQTFNLLPVLTAVENVSCHSWSAACDPPRRDAAPWQRSNAWAWANGPTTGRPSFRADSASAFPSPARSSTVPRSSGRMSRRATSTARRPPM